MNYAHVYASIRCVVCGRQESRLQSGPRVVNYCSSACRQKAYRQRKKVKNDNE
jgi:hypothetical protein